MQYSKYNGTGKALAHARAGPDHGINLPVLEHVFPSGPSMCFRHICGCNVRLLPCDRYEFSGVF